MPDPTLLIAEAYASAPSDIVILHAGAAIPISGMMKGSLLLCVWCVTIKTYQPSWKIPRL